MEGEERRKGRGRRKKGRKEKGKRVEEEGKGGGGRGRRKGKEAEEEEEGGGRERRRRKKGREGGGRGRRKKGREGERKEAEPPTVLDKKEGSATGETLAGVLEEIRMIKWPDFGKVLGKTGVVLSVIAGSSVVLLTVNAVFAELSSDFLPPPSLPPPHSLPFPSSSSSLPFPSLPFPSSSSSFPSLPFFHFHQTTKFRSRKIFPT
uniref:Uncharacterized protein n=1 Tax=Nymphaea colorata TaxID=210225 RepID=A0A5K1AIK1_9MAGN